MFDDSFDGAEMPPDSLEALERLRQSRSALWARFEEERRRNDPAAARSLLALDPVMVLDAPPAQYAAHLDWAAGLALEHDPPTAARLLRAKARFWTIRGAQRIAELAAREARAILARERIDEAPVSLSILDFVCFHTAYSLAQMDEAASLAKDLETRARSHRREHGAARLEAIGLLAATMMESAHGDNAAAIEAIEAAIDAARRARADRTLAVTLAQYGVGLARAGRHRDAKVSFHKSAALFHALGDTLHTSYVQSELLLLDAQLGHGLDPKRTLDAANLARSVGDDRTAAHLLISFLESRPGVTSQRRRQHLERRVWLLLGRVDDPELEARALALLERAAPVPPERSIRLEVARDGRLFRLEDRSVDLARRRALPRVLVYLARLRIDQPGHHATVEDVFAGGWPGERALPHAAAARVYMAIRALRNLGLKNAIATGPAGYRIDPAIAVSWVEVDI